MTRVRTPAAAAKSPSWPRPGPGRTRTGSRSTLVVAAVICSSSRHVIVTANKGIACIARCREIALWRQGDTASAEKSVHLRLVGTDQFDLGVVLLRPSHLYQSLVP